MIDDLKTNIRRLADRMDALSLRERALFFIAVMVVMYLVAVNLVFSPLRTEQGRIEQQLKAKREQVRTIEAQIQTILASQGRDPDAENRSRIAALKQRLESLKQSLGEMTVGLVSPQEMAKLVEQMLLKNRSLELLRVESLPPAPIGEEDNKSAGSATEPVIYKHGLRIEFTGRYFDIQKYLQALEALPWKVYWGQVNLETQKHPVSKVVLVIYTLSNHRAWIGV